MTDETKLAHLKRLCSPNRTDLMVPFLVHGANAWSCATDGKWMFAWRGDLGVSGELAEIKRTHAAKWLSAAAGADVAVPMTKLREFCGPALFPRLEKCTFCDDVDGQCDECDGEGELISEAEARHGLFFGTAFNLWRVAALLDGLEDETVWIRVVQSRTLDKQQLQMHGADWIALLMPMKLYPDELETAAAFSEAA